MDVLFYFHFISFELHTLTLKNTRVYLWQLGRSAGTVKRQIDSIITVTGDVEEPYSFGLSHRGHAD